MSTFYVVTDCEFDGPTPGAHSMLAFASVAITDAGVVLGEFESVLEPLEGATRDESTMAFGGGILKPGRPRQTNPNHQLMS